MALARVLKVAAVMAVATAAVLACTTDYQKGLDDPNYGAPNALAGQKQPGSTSDNAAGSSDPSGGPGGALKCGQAVDGGPCTASFRTDVLGAFKAANCGVSGCHGGATPANQPAIDTENPVKTWDEFQKFTLSNGKAYINPCSTDPATSTIACNVNGTAACGVLMPSGNPTGLPDAVAKIDAWLKCGSPNN